MAMKTGNEQATESQPHESQKDERRTASFLDDATAQPSTPTPRRKSFLETANERRKSIMSILSDGKRKSIQGEFKRNLGLLSVISYLIGGIIGTGIFISPTGVLIYSGSPGVALLVWVGCGLVAMLAALCFAELGTSFPHSGSSYIYVKLAFGDFAAFVFEWVDVILRKSTTSCVRYLTFAIYFLQPFYGLCRPPTLIVRLVAAVAMFMLTFINLRGVKFRSFFQIITTAAKLLAMVLIFGLGMYYWGIGGTNYLEDPFRGSISSPGSIAMAFSYGLYAYSGWDIMNTAIEEIRKPNTVLPLAIAISMVIVTLTYTMVNVAYFIVLDVTDILDSTAVASVFGNHFLSASGWIISILVSLSAIGSCNAVLFQTSRYCFACAREGQLPKFMAGIHPKYNSPQPSILVMTLLAFVCLTAKDINQLLVYYGILKWSMVAFPIAAQIYLRIKYPDLERPIKLPLFLPVLTLLILMGLLIIPIYENWFNSLIAVLLCCICVPVYLFFFTWKNKPSAVQNAITSLDNGLARLCQKLMLVIIADSDAHDGDASTVHRMLQKSAKK